MRGLDWHVRSLKVSTKRRSDDGSWSCGILWGEADHLGILRLVLSGIAILPRLGQGKRARQSNSPRNVDDVIFIGGKTELFGTRHDQTLLKMLLVSVALLEFAFQSES